MPDYQIGRVALVDEESGEQTPIDVRTRPEAVTTTEDKTGGGKKTLEEKLAEYNAHVENMAIHSDAYIQPMYQVTIPTVGWEEEAPEGDDFSYSIEMSYLGVLESHNAEVTVDRESIQVAFACGLCPTMETMQNGLKFWARSVPTQEILCHMTLFGAGGLSGGNTQDGGGN